MTLSLTRIRLFFRYIVLNTLYFVFNEEELLALQQDPIAYNNEVIFPDKVRINLKYLQNRTFRLDIKLIVYTVLGKKLEEWWSFDKEPPPSAKGGVLPE